MTLPSKTYEEPWATIAKEHAGGAGDALDKKVIEAAIKQTKELGCFVAGTLVHTREGLRPIEQVQVGDYVLSKPESGAGEASYQRVTRTYEYDDRVVYFMAWSAENPNIPRVHPMNFGQWDQGYAVVTGAHPFWVKHAITIDKDTLGDVIHPINAWMSIEEMIKMDDDRKSRHKGLGFGFYTELVDGRVASLWKFEPVLQMREPNLGLGFKRDPLSWAFSGTAIHFTPEGPIAKRDERGFYIEDGLYEDDAVEYDYDDTQSLITRSQGYLPMLHKVYNLEVENTHTYYVGDFGVWVHNTSGIVLPVLTQNPAKDVGVFLEQGGGAAFSRALNLL